MAVVQAVPGARQPLQAIGEQNAASVVHAQQPSPYEDIPIIVYANEQKALKSEDVIYVRRVEPSYGNVHSLFVVCDGHQGAGAANHCVEHMPGLLGQLLPPGLPAWKDMRQVVEYAEQVRRAISTAAVLLDNDWTRICEMSGGTENAGTTLTLAVVSGWLLTVANTGDSNAIIDTGDHVQEITHSHRIQVNKSEQNRLRQSGAQLAPLGFHLQGPAKPQEMGVGPLRMWPGGLCVSRSIGDLDSGPLIVPLPHVRQVLLTRHRAVRLIMASDGLWDLVSFTKAAKSVRHKLPHQAVSSLVQMVARDKRMADDVSIIILDLLPPPAAGVLPQQFPASALQATAKGSSSSSSGSNVKHSSRSGGGGGLFSCFKSSHCAVLEPMDTAAAAGCHSCTAAAAAMDPLAQPWNGLQFLADVDCYEAYPVHGQQLARASVPAARRPSPPPKKKGDYTVHGGHAHKFQQDTSWHTGDSQHGATNLPMFLTQQQLEQLQVKGPAAAAGMTLNPATYSQQNPGHGAAAGGSPFESFVSRSSIDATAGSTEQERMLLMMGSGALNNSVAAAAEGRGSEGRVHRGNLGAAAAAAATSDGSSADLANNTLRNPSSGLASRPSQPLPTAAYGAPSGGASSAASGVPPSSRSVTFGVEAMAVTLSAPSGTVGVNVGGASGTNSPCPAPGALHRSASAQFENPDGSGVYVAGDEGGVLAAPGRVVGVAAADQAVPSHFGSAPSVAPGRHGGVQDATSLAAAATAAEQDDEDSLRAMAMRSASNEFAEGPGSGI